MNGVEGSYGRRFEGVHVLLFVVNPAHQTGVYVLRREAQ
jgi:hypothetical protein